jgi:hypothetical protein
VLQHVNEEGTEKMMVPMQLPTQIRRGARKKFGRGSELPGRDGSGRLWLAAEMLKPSVVIEEDGISLEKLVRERVSPLKFRASDPVFLRGK